MSLGINLIMDSEKRACGFCESHNCCGGLSKSGVVFETNITHNLREMARKAKVFNSCWFPVRIVEPGVDPTAKIITPILERGLARLKADPEYFRKYDDQNGWGTYDQFVPWLQEYLNACLQYPEARIEVSR